MNNTALQVIIEDNKKHPYCSHGPTLLFLRNKDGDRKFFACAACRDRKDCAFFLWEDELSKFSDVKKNFWESQRLQLLRQLPCHKDIFVKLHKIKQTHQSKRYYCHNCHELFLENLKNKHETHKTVSNISNELLENPSRIFQPKDNAKKEAQYLFSTAAVKTIVDNLIRLKLRHIICIGAPRVHEYIQNNLLELGYSSLLLDIDERFRHFYGPLQFCLYNSFNHYFFEGKVSETVFNNFLKTENGNGVAIVTDPPFGGRVEALANGIRIITTQYKCLNKISKSLPVLWIFPYFMESHILNSFPNFSMLDYKVDYDNHSLFTDKSSGRKYGSPVRIFTNIPSSEFVLPSDEGYKFCTICKKWVSQENQHCKACNECTSKNGTTYIHCNLCKRCVKPSWKHCSTCNRCCIQDHKCGQLEFNYNCFHCKLPGHKKNDCPNINRTLKRKHDQFGISSKVNSPKGINTIMYNDTKENLDYEVLDSFYSEINDAEYEIIRVKVDYLIRNFTNICEICQKTFSQDKYLQKHKLNQHNAMKFEEHETSSNLENINLNETDNCVQKYETNENIVIKIEPNVEECIDKINKSVENSAIKNEINVKKDISDNEQNQYKCNICLVTLKTNQGYQNHLKAHRIGSKIHIYKCTKCPDRFLTAQRLTFHVKYNHSTKNNDMKYNNYISAENENLYKCSKCFRTFKRSQGLSIHMKSHQNENFILKEMYTPDGQLQCTMCSKTYASYKSLRKHIKVHKNFNEKFGENEIFENAMNEEEVTSDNLQTKEQNEMKCTECLIDFTNLEDFSIHNKTIHNTCNICSKVYFNINELNDHVKVHENIKVKKWSCEICKKKFTYEKSRDIHVEVQHNGRFRSHLCTICGKAYNRNQQLIVHMRNVHSGIKPHLCSFCGKAFSTKRFLEAHMRTHTKEKPFKCDECGKGFIHKPNMIEHKRIHSGQKPHICTECGKQFTHLTGLRQHSVYHTGIKKYICPICDQRFYFKNKCDDHMRLHSGELPYSCKYCDKKFRICNGLKRHVRVCRGIRDFKCNICEKTFTENSHLKQHLKTHERSTINQNVKSIIFPKIDDITTPLRNTQLSKQFTSYESFTS